MKPSTIPVMVSLMVLAACGDKVPQSEAAKRVGDAPKQTINKASGDVTKALEQGAARNKQADE